MKSSWLTMVTSVATLGVLGLLGSACDGAVDVTDDEVVLPVAVLLFLDGGEGAKKNLAKVGENGGAARGDTVLDQEDGDLGEESVNLGGGLEPRKQTDKSGGEIFVGGLELASRMAETEAGFGIGDSHAAAAPLGVRAEQCGAAGLAFVRTTGS